MHLNGGRVRHPRGASRKLVAGYRRRNEVHERCNSRLIDTSPLPSPIGPDHRADRLTPMGADEAVVAADAAGLAGFQGASAAAQRWCCIPAAPASLLAREPNGGERWVSARAAARRLPQCLAALKRRDALLPRAGSCLPCLRPQSASCNVLASLYGKAGSRAAWPLRSPRQPTRRRSESDGARASGEKLTFEHTIAPLIGGAGTRQRASTSTGCAICRPRPGDSSQLGATTAGSAYEQDVRGF